MQFTTEQFTALGLEESEAKVYAALLELGPSTVSEITKAAGITRTLGYHVLEKLGWHGLVNEAKGRGKKKTYTAEHPRQLLQFVKNKEQSWSRRAKEAEALLPDLLSLYKVGEKPVIRYQEGKDGVISLFEESLESKTEILSVLDVESWQQPEFWEWARGYNRERNRRKIAEKILIQDTKAGREWIAQYKGSKTFTKYRWIQPNDAQKLFQFGGELNIYENKVMIALLKQSKRMGILIESAVLTNILRALFLFAWDRAREVSFRG